jgi:hypothetical protein
MCCLFDLGATDFMEIRFGFGEYERTEVEVRQSVLDMRYQFLGRLIAQKPGWAETLVRLSRTEPTDLVTPDLVHGVFHYLIAITFGRQRPGIELLPELSDTPLQQFAKLIRAKTPQIERLGRKELKSLSRSYPDDRRLGALMRFMPNYQEMAKRRGTSALAKSLREWAESQNLADDWCLDFALSVLINYWALLSARFGDLDSGSINGHESSSVKYSCDFLLGEAAKNALDDYRREKLWVPLWKVDEDLGLPVFKYDHGNFKFGPLRWLPLSQFRRSFTEDTLTKLDETLERVREFGKDPDFDFAYWKALVTRYCDEVEKHALREPNARIYPFPATSNSGHVFFSATWYPSQSKEGFIKQYMIGLRKAFKKNKKMAASVKMFPRKDFVVQLSLYCDRVEKKMPANYQKTPAKYERDLPDAVYASYINYHLPYAWLVDYQVPAEKDCQTIVDSHGLKGKITAHGIKTAIRRAASELGIRLRPAKRTGRPKGANDQFLRKNLGK